MIPLRKRWQMFYRARRLAVSQRGTFDVDRSTFQRLAVQWAGPYLPWFLQSGGSSLAPLPLP